MIWNPFKKKKEEAGAEQKPAKKESIEEQFDQDMEKYT